MQFSFYFTLSQGKPVVVSNENCSCYKKKPKTPENENEDENLDLNIFNLDVQKLLSTSISAKDVFGFFKKNNCLEKCHQQIIAKTICEHFVYNKIKLHLEDMRRISESITAIFTSEDKVIYIY